MHPFSKGATAVFLLAYSETATRDNNVSRLHFPPEYPSVGHSFLFSPGQFGCCCLS